MTTLIENSFTPKQKMLLELSSLKRGTTVSVSDLLKAAGITHNNAANVSLLNTLAEYHDKGYLEGIFSGGKNVQQYRIRRNILDVLPPNQKTLIEAALKKAGVKVTDPKVKLQMVPSLDTDKLVMKLTIPEAKPHRADPTLAPPKYLPMRDFLMLQPVGYEYTTKDIENVLNEAGTPVDPAIIAGYTDRLRRKGYVETTSRNNGLFNNRLLRNDLDTMGRVVGRSKPGFGSLLGRSRQPLDVPNVASEDALVEQPGLEPVTTIEEPVETFLPTPAPVENSVTEPTVEPTVEPTLDPRAGALWDMVRSFIDGGNKAYLEIGSNGDVGVMDYDGFLETEGLTRKLVSAEPRTAQIIGDEILSLLTEMMALASAEPDANKISTDTLMAVLRTRTIG